MSGGRAENCQLGSGQIGFGSGRIRVKPGSGRVNPKTVVREQIGDAGGEFDDPCHGGRLLEVEGRLGGAVKEETRSEAIGSAEIVGRRSCSRRGSKPGLVAELPGQQRQPAVEGRRSVGCGSGRSKLTREVESFTASREREREAVSELGDGVGRGSLACGGRRCLRKDWSCAGEEAEGTGRG